MNPLLEVKNIKKYFNTKHGTLHAVDDISFTISKGQTMGVVGESGCGKSTLGRVILHLIPATSGQIIFNGNDISNPSKNKLHALRRNMQMVFQDPFSSLNPRLTVSEIIGEPLKIYNICSNKEEYRIRVLEIMDTVGLPERYVNTYPHELDGGRRQRIGLGRAIALNPEFIVCDEPVSALDVSIQAQILNLMQDLQDQKKLTYIFVTHDLSVVKHISNDILVMYLGIMVEKCASPELFSNPLHPYTKALLSAIPSSKLDAKKDRIILRGELSSPINLPQMCRFAPRCIYSDGDTCIKKQPVLEEVLPGHFTACHKIYEINKI